MGNVIGQRWEVYEYEDVEKETLKKGEKIVVRGTPDFGEAIVELISPDKARTVAELYADWKDGVGSPFRTSVAQDEKDKNTLAKVATINEQIQITNNVLDGLKTLSLTGALLTRVINGKTEVARNLFSLDTVFVSGKTLINDVDGTIGVYTGDKDSAIINVITKTIAPVGAGESINLGVVQTNADLLLTVEDAVTLWGRNPNINDYVTVQIDETMLSRRVEWYIVDIVDNVITWGNPVPINTGDYQQQTTVADDGLVLTGGERPGTHGKSIPIDTVPAENSNNLVASGGIWSWFGAALSILKTTAKNIIGAINELFDRVRATHPVGSYIAFNTQLTPSEVASDTRIGTWEYLFYQKNEQSLKSFSITSGGVVQILNASDLPLTYNMSLILNVDYCPSKTASGNIYILREAVGIPFAGLSLVPSASNVFKIKFIRQPNTAIFVQLDISPAPSSNNRISLTLTMGDENLFYYKRIG